MPVRSWPAAGAIGIEGPNAVTTRKVLLSPSPAGVSHARGALTGLEGQFDPAAFFDASLCVSELVTSAIRAVEPGDAEPLELELLVANGALRAAVTDRGAAQRRLERIIGGGSRGDFGLYIISRLARRWGVDRVENRIWFELSVAEEGHPRGSAFHPEHATKRTARQAQATGDGR